LKNKALLACVEIKTISNITTSFTLWGNHSYHMYNEISDGKLIQQWRHQFCSYPISQQRQWCQQNRLQHIHKS